jgi:hypothetical protein
MFNIHLSRLREKNIIFLKILGLIAIVIILMIVLNVFNQVPVYESVFTEPEITFEQEGNLVFNNPGLDPNQWYLVFDKPGAPGQSTKLVFDKKSQCFREMSWEVCDEIMFDQGERVQIEGQVREEGLVYVVRLLSAE